jgi:hypothetical protein
MENPPAGIAGPRVDHLTDLVVCKVVENHSSTISTFARLLQQEMLQGFIQSGESLLRRKLGYLAELLKGEVLLQDCPCYQQGAGRGRELGQAALDQLANVPGK